MDNLYRKFQIGNDGDIGRRVAVDWGVGSFRKEESTFWEMKSSSLPLRKERIRMEHLGKLSFWEGKIKIPPYENRAGWGAHAHLSFTFVRWEGSFRGQYARLRMTKRKGGSCGGSVFYRVKAIMKKSTGGAKSSWVRGCKERGEWAELCFMARAAGLGMGVLKPFGDSLRFDVGVLSGGRIWRVQVKSTIYSRRGNEYSLNVMGPGRKQYRRGTVDLFAVYLIPVNQWYIIPYEALGKKCTLHFTPGGKRQKYARFLEAWELLRGEKSTLFCDREGGGAEQQVLR